MMEEKPEASEKESKIRRFLASLREDPGLTLSRLALGMAVPVSLVMVEILNGNNLFSDLALWQIIWNLVWYTLLFSLCRLACRANRPAAAVGTVLSFLAGLANHYVYRFRGRTIFPVDLLSLKTAANVAGAYDYGPDKAIWTAAAILVLFLAVLFLLPKPGKKARLRPRRVAVACAAWAVFLAVFFFTPLLPALDIYAQQWITTGNGFLFNFMVSLRYSFVTKPDGYTNDKAEAYLETRQEGLAEEASAAEMPENLIVIMNESYADLTLYQRFKASADPLYVYHDLTENTIKGWMLSPVVGGGTATVEFEYLTGIASAFLPEGTIAYQMYVDRPTPSLAWMMKELGYETVAFHPYLASGWNRTSAYELLGFDRQLYLPDVTDPSYVRSYISDACDYRTVEALTEEIDGPAFIFNVTMQNHSSYKQTWQNLPHVLEAQGVLAGDAQAEQYLNLLRESDRALQELLDYYSACPERTMLVFFGDHQPFMSDEFYEALYGKKLSERTVQEILTSYRTPFFIWANYDIPEQEGLLVGSSLLGGLTAEAAGLPACAFTDLLRELYETIPAIHTIGVMEPTGGIVMNRKNLKADQAALLEEYEYVCRYSLFEEIDPAKLRCFGLTSLP